METDFVKANQPAKAYLIVGPRDFNVLSVESMLRESAHVVVAIVDFIIFGGSEEK